MKKNLLFILALILATSNVYASQNYEYEVLESGYGTNTVQENYVNKNGTLKGRIVTVPAGQTFKAVVTTPVSSATAILGQNVTLILNSDFYVNGNLIAPIGSTVIGSVVDVSKAKIGSINGKLMLRFNQIVTPTGQVIPITATVKTTDGTGILEGGTGKDVAKEYTKDLAIGAGAGALAGVIISPLAGGSIGRGTALSTAVGAGGGLVKSIVDKGNDVDIPTQVAIDLVLLQPITVNPISNVNSTNGQ